MTDRRKALGKLGESLAARELERRGYRIVERNWRCPAGEMDLVAEQRGVLVFVEVRTRRGRERGTPEESLTPRKQAKLIEVAQAYLEGGTADRDWRIDVVAVELSSRGELLRVDVIENAIEEKG
ncbi:MAG TPA: YraN family protein [Anaerolineae bacterium]|nr:YraN family protein [Anaerolineae bacterium]